MRLDRVYIDGFKNLNKVEIDFDETCLTTVIIGQNGSGKSNLIEAITDVFRFTDLNRQPPRFRYEVDYTIGGRRMRLSNRDGKPNITADDRSVSRKAFDADRRNYFPDLVFGYYSGNSRKLESLFDSHQRRYYSVINKDPTDGGAYADALNERRLFYCRQVHGVLALLTFFAFQDDGVSRLLREKLGITRFHSALAHLKQPTWFTGRRSNAAEEARDLWGARGPAGACGRALLGAAFHPMTLQGKVIEDYRDKQQMEMQLACFLRDQAALRGASNSFESDQDMFAALEALDISDLLRDLLVWVEREQDESGDIGFADLSDGERQLLMVLGLIRISRNKRALFLLDEPDTHLNPAWQHSYLDLIKEWTGATADAGNCQIVLTSHNPLTIAGLEAREVRLLAFDEKTKVVTARKPFVDPKGLGFSGVLTDVFGLASTLDRPTQELVDERNRLARKEDPSPEILARLDKINDDLRHLGFLYEERDKLYSLFLRKLDEVELADVSPLTPDEMLRREREAQEIVEEILRKK